MDQNQTDMLQDAASPPPAADVPAADVAEVTDSAKPAKQKKTAADKAAPAADVPAQVELEAPHGFIDESGAHRFWPAGAIVTVESEIKLLLGRFAPLVGINYNRD
ncbi:hypothetical protein [Chromobacterium violaceum]|uniref:hypothetical protein n=1 Tax=Chromobacterium violaceum TaxID=536 RepID=UPI00143E07FC|nr:hypothetical protein [Chromobacterium violaceum]QIY81498.1 hypothetical protein FOB43_21025 [Chromobacterium violaceum]